MRYTAYDVEDFDEDEETLPAVEILKLEASSLAKFYISEFFRDKELHCGGPIPRRTLVAPAYVSMVLDTDICDGAGAAYQAMASAGFVPEEDYDSEEYEEDEDDRNVPSDVKLVVSCLEECERRNIPKEFAAGITLMHLELCLGVSLDRLESVARLVA